MAKYFDINAYELLEKTFGGSGYDIAAAFQESPFIYQNANPYDPTITPCEIWNELTTQIYFVYLGKKQNTNKGIIYYREKVKKSFSNIVVMNAISDLFLTAKNLNTFNQAIQEHEYFVSKQLQLKRAKDLYFKDYWGEVKSLGAWGGDFVMVTHDGPEEALMTYMNKKDFSVVIPFRQMIKL